MLFPAVDEEHVAPEPPSSIFEVPPVPEPKRNSVASLNCTSTSTDRRCLSLFQRRTIHLDIPNAPSIHVDCFVKVQSLHPAPSTHNIHQPFRPYPILCSSHRDLLDHVHLTPAIDVIMTLWSGTFLQPGRISRG